ncbi:MAG: nucleotide exchange factor GrpE [Firmicutes bacterium]|nr:nucleotide exchange factor GrpE [Bacillota bacterium]
MDVSEELVGEDEVGSAASQTPSIHEKLDALISMFEEKIQFDEGKDRAFNKLYGELEMFKNDFVERRMKEVYTDLLLLYDNVKSYIMRDDVQAPGNEVARRCLEYALEEVLEVLYRRGIELVSLESDTFDPRCQRALYVEGASSSEEDGKVVRVVKDGFIKDDKVLRHQMVVVARSSGTGEEGVDD